jgi:hypothetical protein
LYGEIGELVIMKNRQNYTKFGSKALRAGNNVIAAANILIKYSKILLPIVIFNSDLI